MKTNGECESGYVGDVELIGTTSTTFTNIRIIHQSAMSITAIGERYGHRWWIKSMLADNDSTLASQRLKKEFEILTGLHHPGIVDAVSIEYIDGLGLSIVMEWIEGKNLSEVLYSKTLSLKEKRRLAFGIVEAVAYMHSMGIVHRDLKPSNIMVRKNGGSPVIVDFGLADTDSHTVLKQAAGTQQYMSPEAYNRHAADTRDDVYSLGIILKQFSIGLGGIIRKCGLAADRRYANAEKMMDAMTHHYAIRKVLSWVAIALTAIAMLTAIYVDMTNKIATSENTILTLNDSISKIQARFEETVTQQELADIHKAELDRVVVNGCGIAEAIFRQFDIVQLRTLRKEGYSLSEINNMVIVAVANSLNQYLDGLKNALPDEDYSSVYSDIWQREVEMYNEWQKNVLNADGYD